MGVRAWWSGVRDRLAGDDGADVEELPLAASPEELAVRLRSSRLADRTDALVALGRHGVRLAPAAEGAVAGSSRLGGAPDLPAGTPWPRHDGAPLSFVGQLDLAALRAALGARADVLDELPESGLLSFFVLIDDSTAYGLAPEERGTWRVLHHDGPTEQLSAPDDLDPDARLDAQSVAATVDWTPAPGESAAVDAVLAGSRHADAYVDAVGGGEELEQGPPRHRFLGNPDQIQGDLGWEAADTAGGDAADWRLLLQVDSDEDGLGIGWGDLGRLYWMIREDDLRAHRWDRVRLIGQCY